MLIVWIIIFSLLGSVGSVGGVTLLAVIAHEIPQEIGDFAVLLDSGYSRQKAFFYNILSSISTLLGAVISYFFLKSTEAVVPYVLAFSAASFIYIATTDLIPNLNQNIGIQVSIR